MLTGSGLAVSLVSVLLAGPGGELWHDTVPMPVSPEVSAHPRPVAHKQGVLFVNFDGATIQTGIEDSRTNTTLITDVVEATGGTFPAFGGGTKREAVLAAVRADWAPFNVIVTDERPELGDYTMNLIGPVYPFGGSVLGIAPVDCRDAQTHNNVTFAFFGADSSKTASEIAAVVSQEVAHSFGLEHVSDAGDIMNPSPAYGDPMFEDSCTQIVGDLVCGEVHAEHCGSSNAQNAYRELLAIFGDGGPDMQPPSVSITYPADGDRFEEGAAFEIVAEATDDNEIAVVELYYFGELLESDEAAPYSWDANLIPGEHEFYVAARDLAGNESMSDVVTIQVGAEAPGGSDDGTDGGSGDSDDGGAYEGGAWPATGTGQPMDSGSGGCGCRSAAGSAGLLWPLGLLLAFVRRRRTATVVVAGTVILGCGDGQRSDDATFGSPTSLGPADGGEADAGSSESGEGSSGSEASTSAATDPTSPTNPTISTSDDPDDSDDGAGGDGAQPESGMYSHCLDVAQCGPVPICLQISDDEGVVFDGICTIATCSDPATDCDPSPGGTAPPICIPVGNESDCVLDCSAGQTCPTNMICMDVGSGMICV